jgi:hypothetical protein
MRPFIQRGSVTFEVDLDNVKLRSLHVQMDPFDRLRAGGIMEMRMPVLGVYAVVLADSKLQTIEAQLAHEKKRQRPGQGCAGLLICGAGERHGSLQQYAKLAFS